MAIAKHVVRFFQRHRTPRGDIPIELAALEHAAHFGDVGHVPPRNIAIEVAVHEHGLQRCQVGYIDVVQIALRAMFFDLLLDTLGKLERVLGPVHGLGHAPIVA